MCPSGTRKEVNKIVQANNGSIIATIVVCAVLLGLLMFASQPEAVVVPTASEIAALISIPTALTAPAAPAVVPEMNKTTFPNYVLDKDDYEEDLMEKEAERLVMTELNSRDFKKGLRDKIQTVIEALSDTDNEQEGLEIENYKDIEDIYSIDMKDATAFNVDEDDGNATVEVEFKVRYILDDDEDLIGKARITVTYAVDELVIDDDFEDAEVDEDFTLDESYLYEDLA